MIYEKPFFICLGAPRAGTTWLFEWLNLHPDVYIPQKEIHFFISAHGRDYYKEKGMGWYSSLYSDDKTSKIQGDIAAGYLRSDVALKRIKLELPKAKLLVMIRNPIERLWSDFQYSLGNRSFHGSFDDFWVSNKGRRALMDGLYYHQIKKWLSVFPPEQMHLVFLDDVKKDHRSEVFKICSFLGIRNICPENVKDQVNGVRKIRYGVLAKMYHFAADYVFRNNLSFLRLIVRYSGLKKLYYYLNHSEFSSFEIDPDQKKMLVEYYSHDIRDLERLARRDLSSWLS